jgi:hypothetical protein
VPCGSWWHPNGRARRFKFDLGSLPGTSRASGMHRCPTTQMEAAGAVGGVSPAGAQMDVATRGTAAADVPSTNRSV